MRDASINPGDNRVGNDSNVVGYRCCRKLFHHPHQPFGNLGSTSPIKPTRSACNQPVHSVGDQMMTYKYIKSRFPKTIISSGSLGVMGTGLPYSIGAQFANSDKTVILID